MATMHFEAGWKSLNKYGEELCGDKTAILNGPDYDLFVLSDGLGSGVKANILSTLTTKIITTMLHEGSSIDEAVDTVSRTLPICKVRKLAYSTFSILQLYHDGRAYLAEFDNPACIYVHGGKLVDLPYEVRDVGGKSIRECWFSVSVGDTFCLISDGVIHAGVGAVLNFGWQWENAAAFVQQAAEQYASVPRVLSALIQVLDNLYLSKPGDDTTALVAQAVPRKQVHLFSGPPVNPAQDEELVHDWMRGSGKKVICGGTSANIAARVLGRNITTDLRSDDPSIPPIGHISGISLVTEGVLTLNRTIEILKQYEKNSVTDSIHFFHALDAQNGAAQLARLLLDSCTDLTCYIGKAINPAHQNPNLPMDLSIKMRLINELVELVRRMGKRVEVRYYG